MRKFFLLFLFGCKFFSFPFGEGSDGLAFSQSEIKGTIKDVATGETLIGVNVLIGEGKGTVTDIDGNYSIKADTGEYTLTVSFVGYKTQKYKVKLGGKPVTVIFSMEYQTLNEVEIVSDLAVERETPVAFSTIPALKMTQELGSRDVPMVLNSTPGVYATEQGGGSGDARITIRGFDQRNVAVLVDGIPVNDMENGRVFWSNWDGLGDITRSMQVQRGLGASKLALASVGGTINIITRGIESKMGGSIKQELGNNNFLKTSISYNSGLLKNGFGVTFAASYKTSDGWVDKTWSTVYSYFFKIQKTLGKHLLSLGVNGAPQSHGQRTEKMPIANYDRNFAEKQDIMVDSIYKKNTFVRSRGLAYNANWGQYIDSTGELQTVTERINYYHKPLFSISEFWKPNEKIYFSTVAYLSLGNGGGVAINSSDKITINTQGQQDYTAAYKANTDTISSIDKLIDPVLHKSRSILRTNNNDHFWYGVLSSVSYSPTNLLSFVAGIDARSYKGSHYRSVYDLLGGEYFSNFSNSNQPKGVLPGDPNYQYYKKQEGDKIDFFNVGLVNWGGAFGQVEIKSGRWSAFFTATGSQTGYQRIDYFKRKDLVINGKVYEQAVGWGDTLLYNGTETLTAFFRDSIKIIGDTFFVKTPSNVTKSILKANRYSNDSPEARYATTDWKWFKGYTFKTGINFNITEHHSVFTNIGYLTMAPRFNNVFDNNNKLFLEIKNQIVKAVEIGYGTRFKKFAANLNGYYTLWENKPPDFTPSIVINDELISYNINGLDALHRGIEADFIFKPFNFIELEGLASIADWKYTSDDTARVTDEQGNIIKTVAFLAKGVHVGNAAQIQYAGSIKFDFLKSFYVKARYTYFGKNYSDFDPITLNDDKYDPKTGTGKNANRESWKMPDYNVVDAFAGYEIKGSYNIRYSATAGVFNVLNTKYISDAQNNGTLVPSNKDGFDATYATVFFAPGRRYNVALKISF